MRRVDTATLTDMRRFQVTKPRWRAATDDQLLGALAAQARRVANHILQGGSPRMRSDVSSAAETRTVASSTGPIPSTDPWGAFADDQLGLMDYLGIRQFLFMGYCIGGCFALKLMERAPERVVAGVLVQTVGHHPDHPDYMYNSGRDVWAPELLPRRPDLNMGQVERYLHDLYRARPEFVYSVSREFARSCQTPILVLPDETPPTRWYPLSRSPHFARMPRSRCSHGASRRNSRPGPSTVCANSSGRIDHRFQRPGSA